jgi:maltodextrin utilization protein YvdJ
MKKIIVLIILIIFLIPQIGLAQIVPGQKYDINYCFEINNLTDYEEQVFILFEGRTQAQIIQNKTCLGYLNNLDMYGLEIYNVREDNFKQNKFNDIFGQELPTETNLQAAQQRANILQEREDYIIEIFNNPDFIRSSFSFIPLGFIPKNDPVQKITDVLNITSLTDNNLSLEKVEVVYTYEDGQTETVAYQDQAERPDYSRQASLPWWVVQYWYIISLAILIAVLLVFFMIRKFSKK